MVTGGTIHEYNADIRTDWAGNRNLQKNGVKRLDLFGSFATGTSTPTSDIDFVVYGCNNLIKLETDLEQIETLRKIDIFDYDSIHNEFLREDIHKYGKQIY